MEVLYPCCCGLDVHKKSITACVLWAEAKGAVRKEKRRFGTFTPELLSLADWLHACGVTHVASLTLHTAPLPDGEIRSLVAVAFWIILHLELCVADGGPDFRTGTRSCHCTGAHARDRRPARA